MSECGYLGVYWRVWQVSLAKAGDQWALLWEDRQEVCCRSKAFARPRQWGAWYRRPRSEAVSGNKVSARPSEWGAKLCRPWCTELEGMPGAECGWGHEAHGCSLASKRGPMRDGRGRMLCQAGDFADCSDGRAMEGDRDLDLGMESNGVWSMGRGLATGTWAWARVLGLARGFPDEGLVTSSVTRSGRRRRPRMREKRSGVRTANPVEILFNLWEFIP
ncbi:hypothetical protein SCHPADRAFT_895417 [Schizopora paradoxa]|uniref:Uncharacterized protein n=1 Tax=Schizopora paradoxa TaxID=27342 RepID=A0A0H2RAG2_9AGAM|nr:hypothetical protein SCHPADRAFT_895417 [Schizopora paradoxa]